MANVIYRDIACANGHEAIYAVLSRLILNGWTTVASSDGVTRTTGAPANAAALNATSAWWLIEHTVSGRKFSIKRRANSYTWDIQVTPGGYALTTGDATTPDNNSTYTKHIANDVQRYPSTGTTDTLLHLVVSDSSASFQARFRRTPFVGGSSDSCTTFGLDVVTDIQWAENPDPCVYSSMYRDDNVSSARLFETSEFNFGWVRLGITGETWYTSWYLENPGSACGSGTVSPSGDDLLYELRWCNNSLPGPLGKSLMLKGLQPYRTPTVGVDSGSTLNYAAFGGITIPNDGVALGS